MGVNPNITITQNSSRIGRRRREEQNCLNSVIKQIKKKKNNVTKIIIMDSSSESNLDEDSLVEVLVRLPVNLIYKFRTVSKLLSNLLSDTVFMNRVAKRFDNQPPWSILFNIGDDQSGFSIVNPTIHTRFFKNHKGFDFKFLLDGSKPFFNQRNLFFIGSSNGLVLCSTLDDQRNYYVCNPLTRKGVLIPQPLNWDKTKKVVHGFTCESSSFTSASYLVFRIPQCPDSLTGMFHIQIFSSDSGKWEVHRVKCPGEIKLKPIICSVVVHNGVLYWTENRLHRIIAYEFIRNYESKVGECRFICFPADRGDDDYHCRRCFCVSEGLICYAQVQRRRQTLSVWILQEEDSGGEWFWVLLQKIDLHDIILENDGEPMNLVMLQDKVNCPRPLALDPGDRNVVILDCEALVFAYNIQTGKTELLNCPSSRNKRPVDHSRGEVFPFVMVPRPTTVPSPSWVC